VVVTFALHLAECLEWMRGQRARSFRAVVTDPPFTPLLPSAYTELLVLAALQPLAVRLHDGELLNMAKNEYRTALDEAKDEVRRTRQLPAVEVDQSSWRMI
jgi:hypothetical protein